MEIGFDGITGRWGPSWKISRREYMEAIFCSGLFSISLFLLLVYNEGNESLCHMTELSRNFITHARVAGLGAAAVKGSPIFP